MFISKALFTKNISSVLDIITMRLHVLKLLSKPTDTHPPVSMWFNYGILNDFLKESDDVIIHVRPHTDKSYYLFPDGTHYGNGTLADTNELPDGRWMTTMSFWLNSSYVLKQLQSLD